MPALIATLFSTLVTPTSLIPSKTLKGVSLVPYLVENWEEKWDKVNRSRKSDNSCGRFGVVGCWVIGPTSDR